MTSNYRVILAGTAAVNRSLCERWFLMANLHLQAPAGGKDTDNENSEKVRYSQKNLPKAAAASQDGEESIHHIPLSHPRPDQTLKPSAEFLASCIPKSLNC